MSNATIRYKQYNTYKDYMNHQASKLDKAIHRNNAMKLAKREKQSTIKFIQEFEPIVSLLERLPVLCLGARRGMEVSAFMKLGFDKSIGIDLNQKKSIQGTVIPGDFHYIPFRSNSFHNIYMNCLDHCLSIDDVLLEINRVLVVDGKFITRIVRDSGAYGSCRWNKNEEVIDLIKEFGFKRIYSEKCVSWPGILAIFANNEGHIAPRGKLTNRLD